MYKLISRLVIYREADKAGILSDLAEICRAVDAGDFDREELAGKTLAVVNRLLDVATTIRSGLLPISSRNLFTPGFSCTSFS